MEAITQEKLETLAKLQSIESETNAIHSMLDVVPEKIESLDQEIEAMERKLSDETIRLDELKRVYRTYEADIEENITKIKKSEGKLREVKTNKEYQSTLKEIETIKTANSKIEDKMIGCLDEMEAVEAYLSTKKDEFQTQKAQIESEKDHIHEESETGKNRIAALQTEWKMVSQNIDPDLMKTYMSVKGERRAAVAAVNKAVCQGCNLNIPPQMYNELQRGDSLRFCPHCQRIIYWKET